MCSDMHAAFDCVVVNATFLDEVTLVEFRAVVPWIDGHVISKGVGQVDKLYHLFSERVSATRDEAYFWMLFFFILNWRVGDF